MRAQAQIVQITVAVLVACSLSWCAAALAAGAAAAPKEAAVIALRTHLGDDQERERIAVYLDGARVGELAVDGRKREAALELRLELPLHRYRLEGEAVIDGERYRIEGAGILVTTARMDEIAERPASAVDAVAAYRQLVAELQAAAPNAPDLADVILAPGAKADAAAVTAAEKRLGIQLPAGYRRLMAEVGAFSFGDRGHEVGAMLPPQALATVLDYYVAGMREDGDDEDELRQLAGRIGKRFRASKRDVVLDHFEMGEPTVLVAGKRCPAGEVGIALPGSDFDLLGADPGDNPLMALIDYDYVMGEPECRDYDRLLAYRLHDHLIEMGRAALLVRGADTRVLSFYREHTDEDGKRLWMRFRKGD